MKHTVHAHWIKYKKQWLIGGGILLGILAIIGFVMSDMLSYQAYERQYTDWHKELSAKTDQALALPANDLSAKDKKRTSLMTLQPIIAKGKSNCDSYPLLHWQRSIPIIQEKITKCGELVKKSELFGKDLQSAVEYLAAEQATAKILATGRADKLDENGWKQQPQHWNEVLKQLDELKFPKNFDPVYQLTKTKTALIQQAWQALVAASDTKDRAKYDEAISQLTTVYGGLGEVSDSSEKSFLPLVTAMENSYKQALH